MTETTQPPAGGYLPGTVPLSPAPTRPPTPWWAYVTTVVGIVVVVTLVVGGATAAAVAMSTTVTTGTIAADGVQRLRLEAVTGAVTVRTDESMGDRVEIRTRAVTTWQEPELVREQDGDLLTVGLECPRQGWLNRCEGAFEVVMAPGTDLETDLVTGGVEATGLAGGVDLRVVTGAVDLRRTVAPEVAVDVTTGGMVLDFAEPPTSVLANADVGAISVSVPDDGTAYDVAVTSGVGGEDVQVETAATSDNVMQLSTSVGGVEVRYAARERRRQ